MNARRLLVTALVFVFLCSTPAWPGYTVDKTSTTAGTDSGGATSSVLRLEVTSVSNGSNYVTFKVSKKDGSSFSTSGTLSIRLGCGSSSCPTVASSSISSGSYSRSFSIYMPTHVTVVTGGKDFYGRYYTSSNGYWSWAGPIHVYCPPLDRPGSTSTTNVTTTSARLNWGSVEGTETYRYQVTTATWFDTSSDGKTCYNCISAGNGTTTSTYRTISGLEAATTYRWRVRAGNATTGQASEWSYLRTFTTTTPTVTSVSPLVATLDELTTFTVYGSNLVADMGFWIADCAGVTELSGSSTYRQFRCTPSYSLGAKAGVVKTKSDGVTLYNFTVDVRTNAVVTSVSPTTATLDQLTTFTVYGSNLPTGMGFWIDQCDGITEISGSSTARRFRCTPKYSLGQKDGVVRDEPGGQVLHNFSVNVTTPIVVNRVDPVRAVRNTLTTFTISGSNLTSGMGFWIHNCANVQEVSGGSSSERQFTCTPSSTLGTMAGEVKTSPGGASLHSFSVEIITPPVVDGVKPVRGALNVAATFYVRGSNLPSGMAFWVDQCAGVVELSGGSSSERRFRCTPQYSLGLKDGVVKVAEKGTSLKDFTVEVITLPVVDEVKPNQAALGLLTTYTVTGSDLPANLAFWVGECEGLTEVPGGDGTERQFRCTPSHTVGSKSGVVKIAEDGTTLESFSVNVVPRPAVDDVKPVRAAFGVPTTFTVTGSDLPSGMGFWIHDCAGVTELPGGDGGERFFECTPSNTLGQKSGVVKVADGGTELHSFDLEVITPPAVTSVSPLAATFEVPTTFTVTGTDLPDGLAFWIRECAGVRELSGGTSTERQFECTPSYTTGTKEGVVKVAEKGTELYSFSVEVAGPPSVTSVDPLAATINELTTFTVSGSNLTAEMGFWIAECEGVTELAGGTSTSRRFQCTPSYTTGSKAGIVKAMDGTELFSFTVEVSTASGVVYVNVSDWAQAAADYLVQNDVVNDPPDHDLRGIFDANRAEVATMLYRALGGGEAAADANFAAWFDGVLLPLFADVADPDVWYFKPATYLGSLVYASDAGGVSVFNQVPSIFRPALAISRAWILKALLEAWNIPPLEDLSGVQPFDDVPTGHPAAGYVYAAREMGIISGTGNLYRPDEWTDRQDLFVMLHRILEPSANPLGTVITKPTPQSTDFFNTGHRAQIGHRYEQPVLSGVQPPTIEISATVPQPETVGTLEGVYTSTLQAVITDLDPNTYVDADGVSHQASAFCAWTADGGTFIDLDPGSAEPFCYVKWIAPIDVSQAGGGETVFTITLYVGDSLGSEVRDQVTLELLRPSGDPTLPAITLDPLPTGLVGGQLMEITGTVADGGDPEAADFGILSVVVSYSRDGGTTWSVLGQAELLEGELWRYVWFLPQLIGDVDVRAEATNLRGNRAQTTGTTTIGTLLAIHGTVVDSYGQPLENAAVVVTGGGLNVSTLADNLGSFRFTSVADGLVTGTAYTLTASLDGRTATRYGLVLTSDAPTLYPVLTLDTSPPLTAASPAGGSYPAPQLVELFCSDDRSGCAVTHYTIDGSTPTTSSPVYSAPVTVGDTTLQFFSIDQAGNVEPVRTETYEVVSVDFADAPDGSIGAPWNYPTRLEDDGARHTIVPGLALGWGVDGEPDGQPDSTAAGDDANGTDDEDGVFVFVPLRAAASAALRIKSMSLGFLDAWLDWNVDGDWLDPGEHIFASQPLQAGDNDLALAVPETAVPGMTFARFRLSSTGGLPFDGPAPDGEVEDHRIEIAPPCTYTLSHLNVLVGRQGGQADVDVTAPAGCPWTAESEASFVSIFSGTAGSGAGTVTFDVVANAGGPHRLGSLTIAGQTFMVRQAGIRIAGGGNHSLFLRDDGTVLAWGRNSGGQLGDGTQVTRKYPVLAVDAGGNPLTDVASVASQAGHTLVLTTNGDVLAWGTNGYGQLGDGTQEVRSFAAPVLDEQGDPVTGAVAVACGQSHSLALLADGTVLAWGRNTGGQLGDGTLENRAFAAPVTYEDGTPVAGAVAVAAGFNHNHALLADGTLIGWGANNYGQAGDGTTVTPRKWAVVSPIAIDAVAGGFLALDGGKDYGLAREASLDLVAWGGNARGQLGDGTTLDHELPAPVLGPGGLAIGDSLAVAAGYEHNVVLRQDGTLLAWGRNDKGQVGDGTVLDRLTAVAVIYNDATTVSGVVMVAAGSYHSLALLGDGKLLAWGYNGYGQLGDGTNIRSLYPKIVNGPGAELSVTVTDSADPVDAAALLSYSVEVTNRGRSAASSVVVDAQLPAGAPFQSAGGADWSCDHDAGTVTCTAATLPLGPAAAIAVEVIAPSEGGTISVTATVSAGESDPLPDNNTASEETTVRSLADLAIAILGLPAAVIETETFTYTLEITHAGPSTATSVTVTNVLPAGLELVNATPSQGSCSGAATATCDLGAVMPAATATIQVAARGVAVGTFEVSASVAEAETDPDPANNFATAAIEVQAEADLRVDLAASAETVRLGESLTYTIVVHNDGPSTATGVAVTDALSPEVAFQSASAGQGSCSGETTVSCDLGDLASGASVEVTIDVVGAAVGLAQNNVTASSPTADPDGANNHATISTLITKNGLVGYWPCDEESGDLAVDATGWGHDGTIYGAARTTGLIGGALDFNGDGNRLRLPGSMGAYVHDHFTVAMWINVTQVKTDNYLFHDRDNRPGLRLTSENRVILLFKPNPNADPLPGVSATVKSQPLPVGEWVHVAARWDGTQYAGFVDGHLIGTQELPYFLLGDRLLVGSDGVASRSFDGLIDEVRIYDRPLTAEEIQGLATRTAGYWKFDEANGPAVIDSSGNLNDGEIHNHSGDVWQRTDGLLGAGLDLGAGSNYVAIPDDGSLSITGPLTVEAWVTLRAAASRIVYKTAAVNANRDNYSLASSDWKFGFHMENSADGADYSVTSTTQAAAGRWYHVAGVYDGQQMSIFVDGVLENTLTTGPFVAFSGPADLILGTNYFSTHSTKAWSNAVIDEVRIHRRALRAEEIALHARATIGYWGFEEPGGSAVLDSSGNFHDGLAENESGPEWQRTSWELGGALDLTDGQNYVAFPDHGALSLTRPFTLETWVLLRASPSRLIYKTASTSGNSDNYSLASNGDGELYFHMEESAGGADYSVTSTTAAGADRWHHVAGVYDGEEMQIYVDGTLENTLTTGAFIPFTGPADLILGSNNFSTHGTKVWSNAVIDEVGIYGRPLSAEEVAGRAARGPVPASGEITRPSGDVGGDVTVEATATDLNGLQRVTAQFVAEGPPLVLCDDTADPCADTSGAWTVAEVDPQAYGVAGAGQVTLSLWVEDDRGDTELVAERTFNWEPANAPASGQILQPLGAAVGDLTVEATAADEDGLKKVSVVFVESGPPLVLCDDATGDPCQGSTGVWSAEWVDPRNFGVGEAGVVTLGLWVRDELDVTELAAVHPFTWEPAACVDDLERGTSNWYSAAGPEDGGGTEPWHLTSTDSHSPSQALFVAGEEARKDQLLLLVGPFTAPAEGAPSLRFWHRFTTEAGHDGGVLEYSVDDGFSWFDILEGNGNGLLPNSDRFLANGYNATLDCCSDPLPGRPAWTGDSGGWLRVGVDLSDFLGYRLRLRWRFGADEAVAVPGWWIDDVELVNVEECPLTVIFSDGFESGDTSAWSQQ